MKLININPSSMPYDRFVLLGKGQSDKTYPKEWNFKTTTPNSAFDFEDSAASLNPFDIKRIIKELKLSN